MLKKIMAGLFGTLILLAGFAIVCYPFFSNYLMSLNHDGGIMKQEAVVENTDDEIIRKALEDARIYNKNLLGTVTITDPFDPSFMPQMDLEYEQLLNLDNDSVMASIEIPKINVNLLIFHGTGHDVLLKGIGHLPNTSLPVGGKSTHSVLTGHTGISAGALFTDLDKLEEGDVFFIHVLNEILAYEVDQIKVVLPTQTKDLLIKDDEDYVTLLTCTPYGVNSHRLLVRGTRIPYTEEEIEKLKGSIEPVESTWMAEYKRALIIGAVVLLSIIVFFIIFRIIISKRRKEKAESAAN